MKAWQIDDRTTARAQVADLSERKRGRLRCPTLAALRVQPNAHKCRDDAPSNLPRSGS